MRLWGWVSLAVLLAFTGCGRNTTEQTGGLPSFIVPKLDADKERLLHDFPLLNDQEEFAPPVDPVTGRAPFGVLVRMPKDGNGTYCSVAHVSPGRVTTNAHCVGKDTKPEEYFVIFYNKRGWKRYERVLDFVYVGSTESDDFAVIKVADDVGRNWETVAGRPKNTRAEVGKSSATPHAITLWSFNPFKGNHPELEAKFNGPGMRFTPKQCMGSRTLPQVYGIGQNPATGEQAKVRIVNPLSVERIHWFVDACDKRPVKGNSGSLITVAGDITQMLGAYHWNVPADPEKMAHFESFEYTGNNGELLKLSWDQMGLRDFYGVATDLSTVLSEHPGLF